ncbi:MAG: hypothetical protein U0521_26260 [Anaerolineae bacterium]
MLVPSLIFIFSIRRYLFNLWGAAQQVAMSDKLGIRLTLTGKIASS